MVKLLDCTLRDGGYYTNWDFSRELVLKYCQLISDLPVSYVEIGYRSPLKKSYFGEYFYLPLETINILKDNLGDKKISIMLNTKDVQSADIDRLIKEISKYVDMVRFAVPPENIHDAIRLCNIVSDYGLQTAINIMYLTKWDKDTIDKICSDLSGMNEIVNYVYLVDSYGAAYPKQMQEIIRIFKDSTSIPIGFHGHNNLELAFANSIVAIEEGVEVLDATVLGMGRGAGNLKTELILSYLESQAHEAVNYNKVSQLVSLFQPLLDEHRWGTNFPYMIAGSHSLPQKEVMDMLAKRRYSVDSIVVALEGMKQTKELKLRIMPDTTQFNTVVILGGGESVEAHKEAIAIFLQKNSDAALIYATTRPIQYYLTHNNLTYLCMTGNEALKLDNLTIDSLEGKLEACVYPPSPRKMGTYIPSNLDSICVELSEISFTKNYIDSPIAIALETCIHLDAKKVMLAGFDGYTGNANENYELHNETQIVINDFVKLGIDIESITPTNYTNIKKTSVYGIIE